MAGQQSLVHRRARSVVVRLVTALAVAVTGTGAASGTASAPALGAFAHQAQAAGLSRAQAGALQGRVDAYLGKLGGVQTAANEISLGNGVTLTLTLPGERQVRSLAAGPAGTGAVAAAAGNCPYYDFCAYQYNFFGGDRITAYYCGVWVNMPWYTHGSFVNNQTPGTYGYLLRHDHSVQYLTLAYEVYYDFNWSPVWYIDPC
jgi:hypothetical protein